MALETDASLFSAILILVTGQPLAGLCNPYRNGCTSLGADIKSCQAKGIKVRSEAFDLWTTSSGGTIILSLAC
ncbi:hypothetical protein CUMW_134020 [Citrus unshiu]|nr:hypothetical protein CUMW_134020 [Citrus unshiu]